MVVVWVEERGGKIGAEDEVAVVVGNSCWDRLTEVSCQGSL